MVEVHAKSVPEASLTFKGGLARTLLWPYRRPTEIVFAILCLGTLARYAWSRDFGSGFWILGLASGFFYCVALFMNPGRLAISGVPTEAIRRVLSELGCTPAPVAEPETWRLQTAPPWVKPSDPRFNVTLDPKAGAIEGTFALLLRMSRRLKAARAG
jgi:hypothetical protein